MDKQEFGKLVMDSETSLYRVAKSILQSDADCADAVSEAVTKAFAKLYTLRNDEYAKTWLIRIVINECRHLYNENQRCQSFDKIEEFDEKAVHMQKQNQNQEEYSQLYEAITKLREEERIAIVLHYIEGFSVAEIAKMTRTTGGTVKSRLSRARKKLRDYYEDELGVPVEAK